MEERDFYVRPVARVNRQPANPPQDTQYNRYVFSLLSSWEGAWEEEQIPEAELVNLSLEDYLKRRPKPAGKSFELFIIDQFEEILSLNPADQPTKTAFFVQIGKLLGDETRWALFSMREDFLGALDPYLKYIPDRLTTRFRLDLLGKKAAAQALVRPVNKVGVEFEEAAVEQLLTDLSMVQVQRLDGTMEAQEGPHIEPVQLQVVAYRLWASLASDDCNIQTGDLPKDVGQALGEYYAQTVAQVAANTGVKERSIREWFSRKLILEDPSARRCAWARMELRGCRKRPYGALKTPTWSGPTTGAVQPGTNCRMTVCSHRW